MSRDRHSEHMRGMGPFTEDDLILAEGFFQPAAIQQRREPKQPYQPSMGEGERQRNKPLVERQIGFGEESDVHARANWNSDNWSESNLPKSVPQMDAPRGNRRGDRQRAKPKPEHYKIVSFSMYNEDTERLEKLVARLKKKGHTKANKSQVIRYALAMVDVDKMPKIY